MIKQEYLRFKWGRTYYYRAIDRGMWAFHGPWYSHDTGAGTTPMLEVLDQVTAERHWQSYKEIYAGNTTVKFEFLTL